MNRCSRLKRRVINTLAIGAMLCTVVDQGQAQQYQPPSFSGMASQAGAADQVLQQFPASPLAGGPAAAQGGEYVDVHGKPIIVQTQYAEPYPQQGYGGVCPPAAAGYGGDPMAVDFGGYGQDQVGPHYFDVQAGAVFLNAGGTFEGLQPFTSAGLGSPDFFLDPANDFDDFDPGWEIAARYDVGALSVLEVAYLGLYDLGYSDSVVSADVTPGGQPNALVSVFNNFGAGAPIAGIDQGITHAIDYQADLQSTEINYRRYWLGTNPRVSGTWLIGARYLRYTDQFQFNSTGTVLASAETASLAWDSENDMVGCHFGGDAWIGLRQGLRIGVESTAGIYNNRFKFNNSGAFSANPLNTPVGTVIPADFANSAEGNQVAFATESKVSMVADILPSWSLRGGYRVMFLNSLVTSGNNISQTTFGTGLISSQAGVLFHGFDGGLEYVW